MSVIKHVCLTLEETHNGQYFIVENGYLNTLVLTKLINNNNKSVLSSNKDGILCVVIIDNARYLEEDSYLLPGTILEVSKTAKVRLATLKTPPEFLVKDY